MSTRAEITKLTEQVVKDSAAAGEISISDFPVVIIERPREKCFGDWSANTAMALSKQAKMNPMDIAEILAARLRVRTDLFEAVDTVRPGFINFRLSREFLVAALARIEKDDIAFGRGKAGAGRKVQVEFVSANPTGPLHIGHGRWAAVGDALGNVLDAAGYTVEREFYINDYGNQMALFGVSVAARYAQLFGIDEVVPENGYHGAYVTEIAQEIKDDEGDKYLNIPAAERHDIFRRHAEKQVIEHIKKVLGSFGVDFDIWFSERSLHESGVIDKVIGELRGCGHVFEQDGAVWLRTTDFGDDKDRVLIRENGAPTYFAADIAYHQDKFERGFDKVINIWGADHHGYVARMKAAMEALGHKPGDLEVIIGQLVNLFRSGEPVRMSKRTGEMVTFEELLAEVGADVTRYLFLTRSTDSAVDFDIELAKQQSQDNPVYYVQYAHARISSIIKRARDTGVAVPGLGESNTAVLRDDADLDLIRQLLSFEETIEDAADLRAPYRLTKFAEETAAAFHSFYVKSRVISDDEELTKARLTLIKCARIVLRNTLSLIGVSAPDSM